VDTALVLCDWEDEVHLHLDLYFASEGCSITDKQGAYIFEHLGVSWNISYTLQIPYTAVYEDKAIER
jgi:hypothetical protein